MFITRLLFSLVALVGLTLTLSAQDKNAPLLTASGVVDKADKDTLTVKPRGADGKFQKTLNLKVTGTSKVTVLTPQKRGEKVVLTQREADAKDLSAGQVLAVIYTEGADGPILLSAVAHPAEK